MIIATLVFIAFSGPVFNPSAQLEGDGPLRLVIDNGWASAQTWDDEMREAKEILAQDTRANRTVYILTTAPEAGGENPLSQGPLAPEQAESLIKGLKPLPWLKDYAGAAKLIQKNPPADSLTTIWLSDGIDENGIDDFSAALRAQGDVSLFTPQAARLPILLRKPEKSAAGKIEMALAAPNNMPSKLVSVQASAEDGRIIDQESVTLKPGQITPVIFNTAESLRGSIARFHLSGQSGAGGTYILDERYRKKSVGIVGPDKESNPKPFVEARYYIERAIEPYATIAEGSADEILKINPAVMILPDIGALAPDTLTALESWVKNGGLLLRFAGPTMAAQDLKFLHLSDYPDLPNLFE